MLYCIYVASHIKLALSLVHTYKINVYWTQDRMSECLHSWIALSFILWKMPSWSLHLVPAVTMKMCLLTMRNSTIDGRFRMPGSEIPHCVCIQAMALPRSSLATTEHDQETPAAHSWEMQSSSCKTGGLHAVLTKLSYNLSSLCPSQGSDLNHHLSFRVSLPIFPHRNLSWEISFMSNCIMVHVSHRTEINIVWKDCVLGGNANVLIQYGRCSVEGTVPLF